MYRVLTPMYRVLELPAAGLDRENHAEQRMRGREVLSGRPER